MLYDKRWDEKKVETKPVEPWRQLLLDAADLIERRGHAKCSLLNDDGSMCVAGALNMATTGSAYDPGNNEANMEARSRLARFLGGPSHQIILTWNNARERTQAEVVAGMRAAATQGA